MRAFLVQPPFVQLNAPYPATHYLEAWLRGAGVEAESFDHSIELYRSIFSRRGLARVFEDARRELDRRHASGGADEVARAEVERYLSYEGLYLEWIDGLVDFLAGGDPGMAHRMAAAAELPRGRRAQDLLDAEGGRVGPDSAGELATRILEDLGDFICYALDPAFSAVRYAERIASSRAGFSEIRSSLGSSYVMRSLYAPSLERFWAERALSLGEGERALVLITVPFPGCLLGGLACAQAARSALGGRAVVAAGGGYVSTELRGLADAGLFDFFDFLSFDAGYGSLASIMEALRGGLDPREGPLYRTMFRDAAGAVVAAGFGAGGEPEARRAREEREAVATVFPDYRSADFGRYLRCVDSRNPMHRLWSEAPWLKYHLARGCYWARCAFCDTELEYVSGFVPARVEALAAAAGDAAQRTGLHGIHFVDEAMPMAGLLAFARENRRRAAAAGRPFHFWGNVRFDASWTADRCELLAASGLVAVSGGIEIATERGLEATRKGFDLAGLVERLVAMRRAGLLVHAYLIYGFPGQSEADVLESAEVCRQLFAAGLVDSAFWHRFVLTRHSRMYADWRAGSLPELRPIDKPWTFASNDLGFEGEALYDRLDAPLTAALAAWMEGEGLDRPLSEWFEPEAGSRPGRRRGLARGAKLDPGLVEGLVARAELALDAARPDPGGRAHWVAGLPEARPAGPDMSRLTWACRGELRSFELPAARARSAAAALAALGPDGSPFSELSASLGPVALGEFLGSGLVVV